MAHREFMITMHIVRTIHGITESNTVWMDAWMISFALKRRNGVEGVTNPTDARRRR